MIVVSRDTVIMKDWDSDGVHLMVVQGDKNETVFISWNMVEYMKNVYEMEKE